MIRVKKFFSVGFLLALVVTYSKTADSQQTNSAVSTPDTNIANEAGKSLPLNDPRRAFRDLFVTSPKETGNYPVQLNPRAISFVQDYMNKHTRQLEGMKGWGKPYFDMMEGVLTAHEKHQKESGATLSFDLLHTKYDPHLARPEISLSDHSPLRKNQQSFLFPHRPTAGPGLRQP